MSEDGIDEEVERQRSLGRSHGRKLIVGLTHDDLEAALRAHRADQHHAECRAGFSGAVAGVIRERLAVLADPAPASEADA